MTASAVTDYFCAISSYNYIIDTTGDDDLRTRTQVDRADALSRLAKALSPDGAFTVLINGNPTQITKDKAGCYQDLAINDLQTAIPHVNDAIIRSRLLCQSGILHFLRNDLGQAQSVLQEALDTNQGNALAKWQLADIDAKIANISNDRTQQSELRETAISYYYQLVDSRDVFRTIRAVCAIELCDLLEKFGRKQEAARVCRNALGLGNRLQKAEIKWRLHRLTGAPRHTTSHRHPDPRTRQGFKQGPMTGPDQPLPAYA